MKEIPNDSGRYSNLDILELGRGPLSRGCTAANSILEDTQTVPTFQGTLYPLPYFLREEGPINLFFIKRPLYGYLRPTLDDCEDSQSPIHGRSVD
jgi:hypothetical protein